MHPILLRTLKNAWRQFGNFWVTPCPIYGLFYACNNIFVSSCERTYHHFCMGVHLETKATICVNPTCGKILLEEWITSVGFNHISMKFKRPNLGDAQPWIYKVCPIWYAIKKLHKWYVVLQFPLDQLKFL
jgi:hypothetical protein